MGGMKDAILLTHDLIETALMDALPFPIYKQIEVNSEGTTLTVTGQDFVTVIADVAIETNTIVVREKPTHSNSNMAIFVGANAPSATGRYISFLLEIDV